MKTPVDQRLCDEARRFAFCFGCEHCAHYDATLDRCGNGYPVAAHRGIELARVRELEFCKEFELGGAAPES